MGLYCGWLNSSMIRLPRSILPCVAASRVRTELRERRQLAELRQIALEPAGHLLHGFDLRGRSDARHRQTHRDGRPDALIEQIRLQIDLAVGNRDDVGRNVPRRRPPAFR